MLSHIVFMTLTAGLIAALGWAALERWNAARKITRQAVAILTFWVLLAAGLFMPWGEFAASLPERLDWPLRDGVDNAVAWLVANAGGALRQISDGLLYLLAGLDGFFRDTVPWWATSMTLAGLAYHASRRFWLAGAVLAALLVILSLGLWDLAMQTLSLMIVSLAIIVLLGLPVGIAMARRPRLRTTILPVLDFMQTIPVFVYLIPAVMLFGLGKVSAILATVIYAVPPLIRLTDHGIRGVERESVEASLAFGASRRQLLFGVQLPLARPTIMAGVNQSIMLALSMVVVASMIGVSGLGQEVLQGLQRLEPGRGFAAGIAIVLLAIVLDRITQAYGRRGGRAAGESG